MSPVSPALLVDSLPLVPPGKSPVFGYIVFKIISLGVSENTSRNSKVNQKKINTELSMFPPDVEDTFLSYLLSDESWGQMCYKLVL